jgi:hypothetical protein
MFARALSHRSKRLTPLTAAVMVVALGGQILAVSHEATVRHFRCAEHGELTHVAADRPQAASSRTDASVGSDEAQAFDGHEHCSAAFTLRDGARPPVIQVVARYTPPPMAVRLTTITVEQPGRLFVLASAPKTSPPSV